MGFDTYLLRLRPSHAQKRMLNRIMDLCCEVFNYLQDCQVLFFLEHGRLMSVYELNALLPPLKKQFPQYAEVNARTLQNISTRVYRSSLGWSQLQEDGSYRLPRHRRKSRMRSFVFSCSEDFSICGNHIHFSKMKEDDCIRFKCNQHLRGEMRICTVVRRKRSWLCYVGCEAPDKVVYCKVPIMDEMGADLGLHTLVTLSDGTCFDRFVPEKGLIDQMKYAQKRLSECKEDDPAREKWIHILRNKHERLANQRENYLRHVARYIADNYGMLAIEDISVVDLVHDEELRGLRRSQYNASWGNLVRLLYQAAKSTGTEIIPVDPFCTSQICHNCNAYVRKDLSVRVHRCWNCGLVMDRDRNAAFNVLKLAAGCAASDMIRKQRTLPSRTIVFQHTG